MALMLFVERWLGEKKSRFVQVLGKVLEIVLLSIGVFSSVRVMKNAIGDHELVYYYCQLAIYSSLMGFLNLMKCCCCCFSSSPLTIIITINLMVLLIFASHRRSSSIIISHHESPPPPPPSWDIVPLTTPETTPSPTIVPIKNTTTTTTTTTTLDQSLFSNQDLTLTPPPPPPTPSAPPLPLEEWKDVYSEKEEEDEETMEATWEAISGGVKQKQKQKKKHLKKSDTWDVPPPPPRRLDSEEVVPSSPKWRELRKAETFNDAVSLTRRGGLIRRDPSMTIEEFNQKADSFIKNFNDNIRLQRQQSIINQKQER